MLTEWVDERGFVQILSQDMFRACLEAEYETNCSESLLTSLSPGSSRAWVLGRHRLCADSYVACPLPMSRECVPCLRLHSTIPSCCQAAGCQSEVTSIMHYRTDGARVLYNLPSLSICMLLSKRVRSLTGRGVCGN